MTNKDKLIQALQNIPLPLKAELEYFMDVEHEGEYDIADAFNDAMDHAENNEDKKMFNLIKPILIEIGFVIPFDVNKCVALGGKKYWFKANGNHYECVSSWESFINS